MNNVRIIIFLVALTSSYFCLGQHFSFQADVSVPDSSAYYKIDIPSSVYDEINRQKSDLRIYDANGNETPYIWKGDVDIDSCAMVRVEGVKFKQKDLPSGKKSSIKITLEKPAKVTQINFRVTKPLHFKRWAILSYEDLDSRYPKRKKRRKEKINIQLSSEDTLKTEFSEVKVKEMTLEVENNDSRPLSFEEISLFQNDPHLVAYLEKGNTYKMMFGNTKAESPDYDLRYFKAKLPKQLGIAGVKNVSQTKMITKAPAIYQNPILIWTIIILVMIVLGLISIRMLKEIS